MNKKLTINTFNEILMKCIPAKKRKELLEIELQTAYALKIEAMEKLVECLNHGNTYEEILQKLIILILTVMRLLKCLKRVRVLRKSKWDVI